MPTFTTQVSANAQNRRLTNTSLTGVNTPSTPQSISATIVPINTTNILLPRIGDIDKQINNINKTDIRPINNNQGKKYGAVPSIKVNNVATDQMLQQTIPECEMESESDEEDKRFYFGCIY
jgi:hypothetical protein